MSNDHICPRYNLAPETLMHVIRDCDDVKPFWNRVIKLDVSSKFFSL
ncbi:hypothetical protein A2U01_0093036, partial [Trifolium medium]|nr:hypothetical protein [Trifolium medium]